MECFDSHAHLNLREFDADLDAALERARRAGVTRILNVGIDAGTSIRARELARRHEGLYASAALHPNSADEGWEERFAPVEALLREGGFSAVGETGLDYYRDHAPPEEQRRAFRRHLALAGALSLPVIVHCREAHADCRRILSEEMDRRGLRGRVVMHCFGGSPEDAEAYVELGALVSFSGVVTFPNARANREAASRVPLSLTLAETDCPWLAPQAHRGRRNEPAFVVHVVTELARVHGIPAEEAARATTANACRVFGIDEEVR